MHNGACGFSRRSHCAPLQSQTLAVRRQRKVQLDLLSCHNANTIRLKVVACRVHRNGVLTRRQVGQAIATLCIGQRCDIAMGRTVAGDHDDRIADRSTLTGTLAAISANASESIALDTVHVRRADDGWSATVEGTAHGASTTQAVFGVDALLKGIRALHTVSVASLDDFAYSQAGADSLRSTTTPVTIAFHLSFTVKRAAGDSAR